MSANQSTTQNQSYSTNDLNLATALKEAGMSLLRIENLSGRGVFIFKDTPQLRETVTRYFNGSLQVQAHSLFQTWRTLKAMTFSAVGNVR